MRCLSTFSGSRWAYGFTFISLPLQILPQIWESWLKSFLLQVYRPCHYTLIEAVEPFKLHFMYMSYRYEDLSNFSGCGWVYGFTLTSLPVQMLPQIWRGWLKSYLMQVCKPCHYAFIEAVEPFKHHPMSMAYIYEVFEHLRRLWMGIWLHNDTITTTDTPPDLWELAEILPYANVQTMPLQYGRGCRTFQIASLISVMHLWGVWAPSQVLDGLMGSHSYCYHYRYFPKFVRVGWNLTWCKCVNHATMLWLWL